MFEHLTRPLDVVGVAPGAEAFVAAGGRLYTLRPGGALQRFNSSYHSPGGEEPYIAVPAAGHRGCSFGRGTVYALRLRPPRGVVAITAHRVRLFARVPASGLIDGIAFDDAGSFGYRLLVTINRGVHTTVVAIGCRGRVSTITHAAPRVEGGVVVAPRRFGAFGGDVIAPDEKSGSIFAISRTGSSRVLARSGLPAGGDIGVESAGFVPALPKFDLLLADRLTPGNRHPGDDVLLALDSASLAAAGVRSGDLIVATEGGARTVAIRCGARGCAVRRLADGPAVAHAEGHIGYLAR